MNHLPDTTTGVALRTPEELRMYQALQGDAPGYASALLEQLPRARTVVLHRLLAALWREDVGEISRSAPAPLRLLSGKRRAPHLGRISQRVEDNSTCLFQFCAGYLQPRWTHARIAGACLLLHLVNELNEFRHCIHSKQR